MKVVKDFSTGKHTLTICLRNSGESRRLKGEVVEIKGEKYFITHQSPKESFAPNTKVIWRRKKKEVKTGKK